MIATRVTHALYRSNECLYLRIRKKESASTLIKLLANGWQNDAGNIMCVRFMNYALAWSQGNGNKGTAEQLVQ